MAPDVRPRDRHQARLREPGSGTTPDLFGNGYVAITDNADDRMNVLVYKRGADVPADQRLVCKVPVFGSGASTTDNSLITWGNSIVVENNYGYENPTSLLLGKSVTGGAAASTSAPTQRLRHGVAERDPLALRRPQALHRQRAALLLREGAQLLGHRRLVPHRGGLPHR